MEVECRGKSIFAIACLGKKLGCQTEICYFREQRMLKISHFHLVKESFKSNQIRHGVSPV